MAGEQRQGTEIPGFLDSQSSGPRNVKAKVDGTAETEHLELL